MISVKNVYILIFYLVSMQVSWSAAASDACSVPVCDVQARIEILRKSSQNDRYQFILALRNQNRKTQDAQILSNIVQVAKAAKELFVQLQEEDWLLRETDSLLDLGYLGLARYSDVLSSALLENYTHLSNSLARLELLNALTADAQNTQEEGRLRELFVFARGAVAHAEKGDEPEYIRNSAQRLMMGVSSRLLSEKPDFQGVYTARLACSSPDLSPELCKKVADETYRLSVIHTEDANAGLVVSLVEKSSGEIFTVFGSVDYDPSLAVLEGKTALGVLPAAHFSLEIDRTSKSLKGWIRNTRYAESFNVTADLERSPVEFFREQGALLAVDPSKMEGIYEGSWDGPAARVILKRIDERRFAATLANEKGEIIEEYSHGSFIAGANVLNLVYSGSPEKTQKMILAYRNDSESKPAWVGFHYSAREGRIVEVQLHRTGSVSQPPERRR